MISVDTVYQTVLALANKEQRGYITPQEFNIHAEHAQMAIFEQYFYDINQFKRIPGNDTKYANMVSVIEDKLTAFKSTSVPTANGGILGSNVYRVIGVTSGEGANTKVVEEVTIDEYNKTQHSPLTKATASRPVYWRATDKIYFEPTTGPFHISYISRPSKPKWTYIVVNEKPLWNSGAIDKNDFDLHPSEQNELVIKILQLSGVTIKDFNLVQAAVQEEVKGINQEKQ